MSDYPAVLSLSSLDGSNGFQINGEATYDFSGGSVASAGDVNGDGYDDFIIGAPSASPNGQVTGASYLIFGKASGFPAVLELSSLDGDTGFRINGEGRYDQSGLCVASAGDINNDGFDDLIVGAYGFDGSDYNIGASYVIYGKASGFAADLELSALDGSNGFQIIGEGYGHRSGRAVASRATSTETATTTSSSAPIRFRMPETGRVRPMSCSARRLASAPRSICRA